MTTRLMVTLMLWCPAASAVQMVMPPSAPPKWPAPMVTMTPDTCTVTLARRAPAGLARPRVQYYEVVPGAVASDGTVTTSRVAIGARMATPNSAGVFVRTKKGVPRGEHTYVAEWSGTGVSGTLTETWTEACDQEDLTLTPSALILWHTIGQLSSEQAGHFTKYAQAIHYQAQALDVALHAWRSAVTDERPSVLALLSEIGQFEIAWMATMRQTPQPPIASPISGGSPTPALMPGVENVERAAQYLRNRLGRVAEWLFRYR